MIGATTAVKKAAILLGSLPLLAYATTTLQQPQEGVSMDESSQSDMQTMKMPMMMMYMSFWSGTDLTWLIHKAESTSGGGYFLGLFVTLLLGVALEAITFLRNYTYVKAQLGAI